MWNTNYKTKESICKPKVLPKISISLSSSSSDIHSSSLSSTTAFEEIRFHQSDFKKLHGMKTQQIERYSNGANR